ncbi:MAG: DUF1566 domain-containing protein [Nitrospirae bacterium]|nr:MAG: DUF1566 domain-containing protein [Nitrospirota bacterium]
MRRTSSMSIWLGILMLWALSLVCHPLAAAERFVFVLDGAGVQDNQTGLIWEQAPDLEHDVWSRSVERCQAKAVGGKTGWRAPTIQELKSLVDPSRRDPALPFGHPFSNIKSAIFWTATPHPTDDIVAWQVSFFSGEPVTDQKSGTRRMWCVLGESSAK